MDKLADLFNDIKKEYTLGGENDLVSDYYRSEEMFNESNEEEIQRMLRVEGWIPSWNRIPGEVSGDETIALPIMYRNRLIPRNAQRFPSVVKLLKDMKYVHMAGFSRLRPQGAVNKHVDIKGDDDCGVVICNIAITLPENEKNTCPLHMYNTKGEITSTYYHQEGQYIEYNPTIAHSAHNNSHIQDRTILVISYIKQ